MKEIQITTREIVDEYHLSIELHIRILDLMSEAGEICKEYNNITDYGKRPFSSNKNFKMEVGDILFSIACIANLSGFSLEDAFDETIKKMTNRIKKSGHPGSGR